MSQARVWISQMKIWNQELGSVFLLNPEALDVNDLVG